MNDLKKLFRILLTDARHVFFTKEQINDKLLKNLRRSKYDKDKRFVDLFGVNVDKFVEKNEKKKKLYQKRLVLLKTEMILKGLPSTVLNIHSSCCMQMLETSNFLENPPLTQIIVSCLLVFSHLKSTSIL